MPVPRCDLTNLTGRLIALHNAAAPNTFSTTVPAGVTGDKKRNTEELQKALLSSDNKVCYRIAKRDGDYRTLFMADSADLQHGEQLPDHIGPPGLVRIKITAGDADYKIGKHDEALTMGDIERWRANVDAVYGLIAHDVANSPLAAFYIILGQEIGFTGYRARVRLANVTRTAACQAPEALEDLVLADAYLMTKKEGDRADFVGMIQGYARAIFADIDAGGSLTIPPLQLAQEAAL